MNNKPGFKDICNSANIVTLSRILLVPVFVILLLASWPAWMPDPYLANLAKPWLAAAVFTLLAATDGVDGYLARRRNQVTDFGKFLDPLADKILVAAALLALVDLGSLPSWIALVILAREFLVSGLRMVAAVSGKVIAASSLGKVKTVFQIIALVMFIVKDSLAGALESLFGQSWYCICNGIAWLLMGFALVLTVISLIEYFLKSRAVLGFASEVADDEAPADASFPTSEAIQALARQILAESCRRGLTLATAESCTGGMVAAAITSIPGSSEAFLGGIVSYDNTVKVSALKVPPETLKTDGAVSEACVLQMAEGARSTLGADLAVATSGVAGPGGGTAENPVGTVWFAVADPQGRAAWRAHFPGNREEVRHAATIKALELLSIALAEMPEASLQDASLQDASQP